MKSSYKFSLCFTVFLSHLSGEEVTEYEYIRDEAFLSHLSGEEDKNSNFFYNPYFLSHLSGEEVR